MSKKIKMIVMDMDDTLLNDELKISDYNKKVISNAQKNGIKIVLASGRPTPSMIPYAKELNLDKEGGYIISYNGANLTDMRDEKLIKSTTLNMDNINFLLKTAQDNSLYFQTYKDGKVIITKENEYSDIEGKLTGMPVVKVENIRDYITEGPVKVILMDEPGKLKKVQEELIPVVENVMTMNISKPFFLEFTNIDVDKNKTLDYLCSIIGINKSEVMAIGDSFNDLTMIKGCGLGIVMANGHEDVKKHAHHVTHCNNTDGVATAINRFALAI